MKRSLIIKGLREGKVQIYCNATKPNEAMKSVLAEAFPAEERVPSVGNTYYYVGTTGGWKCTTKPLAGAESINLSQIEEPETELVRFYSGEDVEVRTSNTRAWVTRQFVGGFQGKFVCFNKQTKTFKPWDQIRKIVPVQKEIDNLKSAAEKHGITINIEVIHVPNEVANKRG